MLTGAVCSGTYNNFVCMASYQPISSMSCAHRLADAGVGTIFCLQEDSDMAYFDLDIKPIIERCKQRGDIKHVRFPVRDFDPFSLRQRLPEAVATLVKEAASGRGKLYIHCTAGQKKDYCTSRASTCTSLIQQHVTLLWSTALLTHCLHSNGT